MSDVKLFRLDQNSVHELPSSSVEIERSLQKLIQDHLEDFLRVRFLASEYRTDKTHGGRIDTLGIDENNCPVIIEYKRARDDNVLSQSLSYLNWLMNNKGKFESLVRAKFDGRTADAIEWSAPRVLCIAGDVGKHDRYAIHEIPRNIQLIRYQRYGNDLVLLEIVAATSQALPKTKRRPRSTTPAPGESAEPHDREIEVLRRLNRGSAALKNRYEALRSFLLDGLGADVQEKPLKGWIAFSRIRNFTMVDFRTKDDRILVYVNVSPDGISLEPDFARDIRDMGYGWPLELTVRNDDDLERAKPLILKSYEAS